MDGRLRRVADHIWQSTLAGYVVIVSDDGGWHVALCTGGGWTRVVLPCKSVADGGWVAAAKRPGGSRASRHCPAVTAGA
jgi:hypothetical protein